MCDMIVWENANVLHASCLFNFRVMWENLARVDKMFAWRLILYPLDECCIFPYRTKINTVCRHISMDWVGQFSQQTQNICITFTWFIQRRPNVFDVGPTLYKCYTNVLCLLESHIRSSASTTCRLTMWNVPSMAQCWVSTGNAGSTKRQHLSNALCLDRWIIIT